MTGVQTCALPILVQRYGVFVSAVTAFLIIISGLGIRSLEVENRFIDYFKEHTEIYQGMELLDARLGGTIPLDVILSAPEVSNAIEAEQPSSAEEEGWDEEGGFFDEAFDIDFSFGARSDTETSYWFSVPGRQLIDQVHAIIDDREASGKVTSLSTAFAVMDRLYGSRLGGV